MSTYADGTPLDAADNHLARADPVMAGLIERFGPVDQHLVTVADDLFGALIFGIIGQQISTHAAAAIYGRMTARFGGRTPTPDELLTDDPDTMRTAVGLSHAKTTALRSLAEHVMSGQLDLGRVPALDDDAATRALVAVKGIGEWTASVFLIFRLNRPDVLARGDLGVRKAAQAAYHLDSAPSPDALTQLAEPWRPHRSRACIYLWRSVAITPIPVIREGRATG